ncbi:Hypp8867 [Branchiostoma lanceolatum]|uniref:Hypp8867 protein n=1 Tax=Branchiostoma lanceolatum TaxID=7740 RepID=A0A8J9Z9T0_BRALA|nr:Hypp8867 [Branchiostoma lanceolatum]
MRHTENAQQKRTGKEEPERNLHSSGRRGSQQQDQRGAHVNCKHGQSWKLINDITNRKTTRKGQLEGSTQEERIENWYNHFKTLLGDPPSITEEDEEITTVFEDLGIRDGPFDQEEYEKARKSLVEGKACGEDGIPPEALKRCKGLDTIILDFCNRALIEGEKPEQWSLLNIIPIPKSGDLRLGSNYRGISLSSLVAKTFNRMLLNRIRPAVDEHLRYNQNGFREGRSTVGHILALRRLIEGIKSHSLPAIITFIDFKKAFDTIHRGKMLKILQAYGIPERIVSAIGRLYENTRAKVTTPDGDTKPFRIQAGPAISSITSGNQTSQIGSKCASSPQPWSQCCYMDVKHGPSLPSWRNN